MRLPKRLTLVTSFVNEGNSLADIGTDHGYVPIALTRQGKVTGAIAIDVRRGPLEQAGEYIREHHLEERIETRLSNGAEQLRAGEVDTVVIVGMDSKLVIHILKGDRHLWDEMGRWVLSPRSELDKVRIYLQESGFVITGEDMVEKDGKYYTVMDISRGVMKEMSQVERLYGAYLTRHKNPVPWELLKGERDRLLKIRGQLNAQSTDSARTRLTELTRELDWSREAQDGMQWYHETSGAADTSGLHLRLGQSGSAGRQEQQRGSPHYDCVGRHR